MSRIAKLNRDELNADGQQLYDQILAGRRSIARPFRVWFHSPEFTRRATQLGEFLRYHTSLSPRLSELVILITTRRQESEVEWAIHEPWHAKPTFLETSSRRCKETIVRHSPTLRKKRFTTTVSSFIALTLPIDASAAPESRWQQGRHRDHRTLRLLHDDGDDFECLRNQQ
jgi:hypothetical protein